MDQLEKKRFLEILEKYNSGNASEEEVGFLDAYYKAFGLRADYTAGLEENERAQLKTDLKNSISENILSHQADMTRKKRRIVFRLAASAAAIVVIAIGLFYQPQADKPAPLAGQGVEQEQIVPGGNKAMLTLANGKKIILSDASNGTLAEQAGVQISKTADGQLVYKILDPSQQDLNTGNQFNTIETPKGGQYQIHLPDGSTVWLNAASKLTYPSSFSSHTNRKVDLTGEAYFEIAKDHSRPFIVKTATQEVEVLGTHFNVNSYEDEPAVKTTLLEGSVKINTNNGSNRILKPGQQLALTGNTIHIANIDTELAVAWKNQQFVFESDDIRYIMRMVSRWYNVEVEYRGPIPESKFGGSVSRFDNVSEVLKPLELTGRVRFKIEGKRIIVTK
ncbi:MAG TPA: FecR family protein [Daejeonella sp.]